jgi:hypothetical protein
MRHEAIEINFILICLNIAVRRWFRVSSALRVVGDENGTPVPGGITGSRCHGGT